MNIEEAKALLAATRAGESDPDNPDLADALRLAEQEPELAAWLETEYAFDEAFSAKLQEIKPPDDLKARLHALAPEDERLGESPATTDDKVISLPKRAWWQRGGILSAAATIVILFAFGTLLLDPTEVDASEGLPHYYDHVTNHRHSGPELHKALEDMEVIRQELAQKEHPVPGILPDKIDELLEIGYGHFEYKGFPVSVIHMSNGHIYHLYLIDRSAFDADDNISKPQVLASNKLALMAWMDNDHLYVLILDGTVEHLEGLL